MTTGIGIILAVQLAFCVIMGIYLFNLLRNKSGKNINNKNVQKELDFIQRLRDIELSPPLNEMSRPLSLDEIVGQEEGIKALKACVCSPNPQHVIIYGPPGTGKTAAARVILDEAKKWGNSPFNKNAVFVEMDATSVRYDERGIADPLMGSVHDPIYQGAGIYGNLGVPQIKPGAVTKAHGGILFIDEIGELYPAQLNKLLKVLEDRKVYFESSYYSKYNRNIPENIHQIFEKGLPADFRLIGATTKRPSQIPPALRSRCIEIFFYNLTNEEIIKIIKNASIKLGYILEKGVEAVISANSKNAREAVNMLQLAGSMAYMEKRNIIKVSDILWIKNMGTGYEEDLVNL